MTGTRARLWLGTFLTLAAGPATVRASETPTVAPTASSNATVGTNEPPGPVPWSLRAEGIVTWDGPGFGVSASRVIARNLAVDGALDLVHFQQDRSVRGRQALDLVMMARTGYFGSRHGLSLGAGPRWFWGPGSYGHVALLNGELAYEYRRPKGISLLIGWGLSVALTRSGSGGCPSGWLVGLFCTERFEPGHLAPRPRLAVGYAF